MTSINQYVVGLVVGPAGLNDAQIAEIKRRISYIGRALQLEKSVKFVVPGFNAGEDPALGMPPSALNLLHYGGGIQGVEYLRCRSRGDDWKLIMPALKQCDEVWCCPGSSKDYATSTARVSRIYRAGLSDPKNASKFKLIPAWVSAQEASTVKQQPKPKKGWRFT